MSDKAWFVLENICCVICFSILAITLDGWWKLFATVPVLFINLWSGKK